MPPNLYFWHPTEGLKSAFVISLETSRLLFGDESLEWLMETIEFYMPALSGQRHCQENLLLREGNKGYALNNIFGKLLWDTCLRCLDVCLQTAKATFLSSAL